MPRVSDYRVHTFCEYGSADKVRQELALDLRDARALLADCVSSLECHIDCGHHGAKPLVRRIKKALREEECPAN